jgi:hypothetical protein
MKKTILFGLTAFLLTFSLQSLFAQRFWISATPFKLEQYSQLVMQASGGAGGASVPGASDLVTFNALGLRQLYT